MKIIHVNASKEYDVIIGKGLLKKTGEYCKEKFGEYKAAIISDDNVAPLYLNEVKSSLEKSGTACFCFIFKAGESSKNKDTLFDIIEFFAKNRLGRNDVAFALGGGVTGDLTGLAAALYQRGMPYVQLPTTLLAAVDSSVGGKTAVNLSCGKNLAGVFCQPSAVLCDTDTFGTLPGNVFACGMAEVIKYGILFDREFFNEIKNGCPDDIENIVAKCVDFKRRCVENDEFDTGERRLLNLGHTFAHAIEKLGDYKTPHGEAVAVGTVMAAKLSNRLGLCSAECVEEIKKAFRNNGLPVENGMSLEALRPEMQNDKKRSDNDLIFILPRETGHCTVEKVSAEQLI